MRQSEHFHLSQVDRRKIKHRLDPDVGHVARIGGITPWLKVAHAAEAFDAPMCPHFLMELHVSLACAVPNGRYVEYIPQLDELTMQGMTVEAGMAVAPNTPGLGIAWDWDAIRRRSIPEFNKTISP